MRKTFVVVCLLVPFVFTACGGGDSETTDNGLTTVHVATFPFAASAPLFLGMKKGFFEKEGLNVKPSMQVSGPVAITTVVSHENEIGFSSSVPLLIARSKGLPVRVISPGELAGKDVKHAGSAVVVNADSPIHNAKDLEDKTIGVVALKDIGDPTIKESLRKRGADPSKLKFVEIPFPDMNAALEAGRVDAAWVVEPFTSEALANGARVISYNYVETSPDLTIALYFTTEEFEEQDPKTVAAFSAAMRKSLAYAQSNPAEVRKVIPTYTEIPASVANTIVLPTWKPDINRPKLRLLIDLSKRYGLLEDKPSLEELIATE
jgi:NitT/TauT family transport system substrate-binding protein